MVHVKNYETASMFVKATSRILWILFYYSLRQCRINL